MYFLKMGREKRCHRDDMAIGGLKVGTCPTGAFRNILFPFFCLLCLFQYFVISICLLNIHVVFCPWQSHDLLGLLLVRRGLAFLSIWLFVSLRVCVSQTFPPPSVDILYRIVWSPAYLLLCHLLVMWQAWYKCSYAICRYKCTATWES